MSGAPEIRNSKFALDDAQARALLARGYCGRLATVSADGSPYVVPLLYVLLEGQVCAHNSRARGHLRENVERDARVCFEVDEPGEVYAYGRFECDTSVSYGSVIAFGRVRIVEDRDEKARFCTALMQKYALALPERPKAFFPRLDQITVYAMTIERLTGKQIALPAVSEQWPATDRTRTPQAAPRAKGDILEG